jgi:hypothetical protein
MRNHDKKEDGVRNTCARSELADSEDGVRRKEVLKFIWNIGVLDKVGVFDTVVIISFTTTIN